MYKFTILIFCLFFLLACSHDEGGDEPGNDVSVGAEKPQLEPLIIPAQHKKPVDDSPIEKQLPQKPLLDLTLPEQPTELEEQASSAAAQELGLLPDLFEKKKKTRRVSIGGGLLRDEETEDFIESIDGAELSIETKID